jgi:hypothetical protein
MMMFVSVSGASHITAIIIGEMDCYNKRFSRAPWVVVHFLVCQASMQARALESVNELVSKPLSLRERVGRNSGRVRAVMDYVRLTCSHLPSAILSRRERTYSFNSFTPSKASDYEEVE